MLSLLFFAWEGRYGIAWFGAESSTCWLGPFALLCCSLFRDVYVPYLAGNKYHHGTTGSKHEMGYCRTRLHTCRECPSIYSRTSVGPRVKLCTHQTASISYNSVMCATIHVSCMYVYLFVLWLVQLLDWQHVHNCSSSYKPSAAVGGGTGRNNFALQEGRHIAISCVRFSWPSRES